MPDTTLISAAHRRLYRDYYAGRTVVSKPSVWASQIEQLARALKAETLIDYGCGPVRGLSSALHLPVVDYDPGVAECAALPAPADLVVSIHALEHVEPPMLDAVLEHMRSLAKRAMFVVVSCQSSSKFLPDGSPWHSLVRSPEWWREKLFDFEARPVRDSRPGAEYAGLWVNKDA